MLVDLWSPMLTVHKIRAIADRVRPLLPEWVTTETAVGVERRPHAQDITHVPLASLELASQLDVVICHAMDKLILLTDGYVVENDTGLKRRRKGKGRTDDLADAVPLVGLDPTLSPSSLHFDRC